MQSEQTSNNLLLTGVDSDKGDLDLDIINQDEDQHKLLRLQDPH
jgi:hypothetical protein